MQHHLDHNALKPRSKRETRQSMKNEPNTIYLTQCFYRLPQQLRKIETRYTTPKDSRKGYLDPVMIWWSMFSESRIKSKLTEWTNKRVTQKIASQSSTSNSNNSRRKKPSYKEWKNVTETLLMRVLAVIKWEKCWQRSYEQSYGRNGRKERKILVFRSSRRNFTKYF